MENHIEEIETGKHDKGFTLVELLIVIVILGILATVTVFAVRGITDKGQDNACKATAKTYETAIEAYYASNTTGPAHPAGTDLEAAGLIRSYNGTDVAVTQYVGVDPLGTSTVAVTATGDCSGVTL